MDKRLDASEVQDICFNMRIDYDSLAGSGKKDKIRELIKYLELRKKEGILVPCLLELRPDLKEEVERILNTPSNSMPDDDVANTSKNKPLLTKRFILMIATAVIIGLLAVFMRYGLFLNNNITNTPQIGVNEEMSISGLPISNWQISFTTNDAEAKLTPTGDGFCANILNGGHDIWDIEIASDLIALQSNTAYIVRFKASANGQRVIRAQVKRGGEELIAWDMQDVVVLKNVSEYEMPFFVQSIQSNSPILVTFRVGDQGAGDVCISDVKILMNS